MKTTRRALSTEAEVLQLVKKKLLGMRGWIGMSIPDAYDELGVDISGAQLTDLAAYQTLDQVIENGATFGYVSSYVIDKSEEEIEATFDAATSLAMDGLSVEDLPRLPGELPEKMSSLLRLSVVDARALQRDKRYRLDMGEWHEPNENSGKCHVCMAGAVMACEMKLSPHRTATPMTVPMMVLRPWQQTITRMQQTIGKKLTAIDLMRTGSMYRAYLVLHGEDRNRSAIVYHSKLIAIGDTVSARVSKKSSRAPWTTYLRAADALEAIGL